MELTGQKWANIKQGSSIFGKTLISLRRLPFGVNVMLNLSNIDGEKSARAIQNRERKDSRQVHETKWKALLSLF